MRTRTAANATAGGMAAGPAATLRRDERASEVPLPHPVHRPGDLPGGRARTRVPRPRHRGGHGGRREGAAHRAIEFPAAVGAREPALLQLVRPDGAEGLERLSQLRPPDGRAPSLRRRMAARPAHLMRRTAIGLLGALMLGVAGCGSSPVDYTEVESAPPTLPIPDASASSSSSAADDSADAT